MLCMHLCLRSTVLHAEPCTAHNTPKKPPQGDLCGRRQPPPEALSGAPGIEQPFSPPRGQQFAGEQLAGATGLGHTLHRRGQTHSTLADSFALAAFSAFLRSACTDVPWSQSSLVVSAGAERPFFLPVFLPSSFMTTM